MNDDLAAIAKQAGFEIIDMSKTLAGNMWTWGDLLEQNPDSVTATMSAGFINKLSVAPEFELTVDVQVPPNAKAVLRTWAIKTIIGNDQKTYFNNIQLTFEADDEHVRDLVAKCKTITREDISQLLKSPATQLSSITVSNQSGGDGTKQTHGERYDYTIAELSKNPGDAAEVIQALMDVLQALKQSIRTYYPQVN